MGASPWENHLLIGHYCILSFLVLYNLIILCEQKLAAEPARPLHWVQPLCALAIWGENFEPDHARSNIYRWFSNMLALNHGDFPHATASVLLELGLWSSRRSWSALRPLMVRWGWHGKTSRFPSSPWKFPSKFSRDITPIRSIWHSLELVWKYCVLYNSPIGGIVIQSSR